MTVVYSEHDERRVYIYLDHTATCLIDCLFFSDRRLVLLLQSFDESIKRSFNQVEDLSSKNHILLELLGEQKEETEELQAELQEAKRVFREQLDQLLPKDNNNNSTSTSSSHDSGISADRINTGGSSDTKSTGVS